MASVRLLRKQKKKKLAHWKLNTNFSCVRKRFRKGRSQGTTANADSTEKASAAGFQTLENMITMNQTPTKMGCFPKITQVIGSVRNIPVLLVGDGTETPRSIAVAQ